MGLVLLLLHYSLSWSGGKDSTASILLAHEHGEPIDSIVFVEVMFDKQQDISGELPQHITFIYEAKRLFESWGYEVYILRAKKDYLDVFNGVIKKPRKHMRNKGKRYGFCASGSCSVKRECKMKPLREFYDSFEEEVYTYVGIAANEQERLASMHGNPRNISLLEKYGVSEAGAKALCQKYGLLSPLYEITNRGGCWFCEHAKLDEHRALKNSMPHVWKQFLSLEHGLSDVAFSKWNARTGQTLQERDWLLQYRQMTIFEYTEA